MVVLAVSRARFVALAFVMITVMGAARSVDAQPRTASILRRTCETSVYGDLGPLAAYPEDQVARAGPVRFLNSWRSDQPGLFQATPSRPAPLKLLVLVDAGYIATVKVPRSERKRLGLLYDPEQPAGRDIVMADGDAAVTFEACQGATGPFGDLQRAETQFNGSMMVAQRSCFDVTVVANGKRYRATLALGVTHCPRKTRR